MNNLKRESLSSLVWLCCQQCFQLGQSTWANNLVLREVNHPFLLMMSIYSEVCSIIYFFLNFTTTLLLRILNRPSPPESRLSEHPLLVMDEMGRLSFRIMRSALLSIQLQALGCFRHKSCINFTSTAFCKIEVFGREFSKWAGPLPILCVTQRGQKLL